MQKKKSNIVSIKNNKLNIPSPKICIYEELSKILLREVQKGPVNLWDFIRKYWGSDRYMLRLIRYLLKLKLIKVENGLIYSREKIKSKFHPLNCRCSLCKGKGVLPPKIKRRFLTIVRNRPKPTFLFDQRPVTPTTTLLRVSYLIERGDAYDTRIVFLGDDDLTSVALALTTKHAKITVLDIDPRLIKFIRKTSKRFGLKIATKLWDLRKPVPKIWRDYFDVFFADPTPSIAAFKTFLNRAIELCNKRTGRGYVCYFPSHSPKEIKFQKLLTEMGFIITDMLPGFTEYAQILDVFSPQELNFLKFLKLKGQPLAFHENMTRVEFSEKMKQMVVKKKVLAGEATREVLLNPSLDPLYKENKALFESLKDRHLL